MTKNIQKEFKKSFGERLKKIRESAGFSRSKVSEVTGLANSTLQLWETGERDPSAGNINMLAELYNVDEAEFFKIDKELITRQKNCIDIVSTLGATIDLTEFDFVAKYDIKASAGHGSAIERETPISFMPFNRHWINNTLRINPKGLAVIEAKGDSMSPDINDQDDLLINLQDTSLRDGIYVLRLNKDLIVKRIQNLFNGNIEIVSSNSVYKTIEININDLPSDFAVIGRVVWAGRAIP